MLPVEGGLWRICSLFVESTRVTDFTSLNLAAPITKALASEGYTTPTPIQSQAIPLVLAGHDLLGIAQTGTGKTAAFALPILDMLARDTVERQKRTPRVLVLAPTRELAAQIADSFRTYGRFMALSVTTVFGGVPINRQVKAMSRGVDVCVATPGRLLDLLDQKAMHLAGVEYLVLDEADQMLDLGFIHALKRIVPLVPKKRQTLFFSATMPNSIADLAKRFLTDPKRVAVAPVASTAELVTQQAVFLNQGEKQALLTVTLRDADINRALVFTRTKHGADKVVRMLEAAGTPAAAIHGNKSQGQRTRALDDFKRGNCKVLVATDIAARGIDVDDVSHVINFDVPNVPEQYVHRIGRTARAGKEGLAISFVAGDERTYLRDIQRLTGQKIEMLDLPDNFRAELAKVKALQPAPAPKSDQPRNGQNRNRTDHSGKPSAKPGGFKGKSSGQKRQSGGQRSRGRRAAA